MKFYFISLKMWKLKIENGKCFTISSEKKEISSLVCNLCKFLWYEYSYHTNFRLPTWGLNAVVNPFGSAEAHC